MSQSQEHQGPAGDAARRALADRLMTARTLMLARIRQRLVRAGLSSTQAEDIFSTTLRRADAAAAAGRLVAEIDDQHLLALATAISRNAVREEIRRERRNRERQDGAARQGSAGSEPPQPTADDAPEDPFLILNGIDVDVVQLRLRGASWSVIAEQLGMTASAAHRRYFRAMQRLAAGG
ncbi:MAG: hypothetical protein FJ254_01330 [Phycisphaerae bacterium]|nr:hypothetical protein [Phycisphaerae bacterium]